MGPGFENRCFGFGVQCSGLIRIQPMRPVAGVFFRVQGFGFRVGSCETATGNYRGRKKLEFRNSCVLQLYQDSPSSAVPSLCTLSLQLQACNLLRALDTEA